MVEASFLIMTVLGPAILLIIMLWVALRRNGRGESTRRTERATHELYAQEDKRRRERTDGL